MAGKGSKPKMGMKDMKRMSPAAMKQHMKGKEEMMEPKSGYKRGGKVAKKKGY